VAGRIDPRRRPAAEDGPPTAPALSASADMGTYLQALRRRWVTAAALGGSLAVVAALAAWFLLSPKYIAFAKVRVLAFTPGFKGPGEVRADFLTTLKTQAAQIMSRPVIWSALKRDEVKRLNLEAREKNPAQFIEEELKVEFQDNSELLTITLGSNDPAVSMAIVKAIVESYLDEFAYADTRAREERVSTLDKAYTDAAAALKIKQDSLKSLTSEDKAPDPQVLMLRLMELQSRIREATAQQKDIRYKLVEAQAELDSHDARMKAPEDPAATLAAVGAALKGDPEAQKIKQDMERFQDIVDDYADKLPGQMPPTVRAARARVQILQAKYDRRKNALKEELEKSASAFGKGGKAQMAEDRNRLVTHMTGLEKLHKKLGEEVVELNKELLKVKRDDNQQDNLRTQIRQDEKLVESLNDQLNRERLELKAAPRISKYQDAELQKKDMKKQILGTIVAPVVVLVAVCMGLAWAEVRQRRVRSAGEVARGLGIRVVGAVPALPNLERHLVGADGDLDLEGQPVLESIDAIRTLLLCDGREADRVVMVTSATTGEGKTTLASHLASSLARAGRKTLLIDGDLRSPAAHQLFELPVQPGFSEVLLGEVELTDAVQATPLEGLSFMAAGQWDREVMQALARDGLEGIFEKLQEEFDFIVIDSHPVLPATDSLLIGQRVSTVILSVLREVSQMPRVYAASQRLSTLGIRVLGAVVNGADPEEALAATAHARMAAA
jgi:capsular exopolysaccharide synthesis family protein